MRSRSRGRRGSPRLGRDTPAAPCPALPLPPAPATAMLGFAPYCSRVRVREYTKLRSLGERAFWTMSIRERRMWWERWENRTLGSSPCCSSRVNKLRINSKAETDQ